jgi:hypothetical protein
VADSVKSNPLTELFAKEGSLDSDSLKDLRVDFIRDFSGYDCKTACFAFLEFRVGVFSLKD